jgi:hypothetical protein
VAQLLNTSAAAIPVESKYPMCLMDCPYPRGIFVSVLVQAYTPKPFLLLDFYRSMNPSTGFALNSVSLGQETSSAHPASSVYCASLSTILAKPILELERKKRFHSLRWQ